MVTRVTADGSLGVDLASQIFARPDALRAAGGFALLLALVPALPRVPFVVLGFALFGMCPARVQSGQARVARGAPGARGGPAGGDPPAGDGARPRRRRRAVDRSRRRSRRAADAAARRRAARSYRRGAPRARERHRPGHSRACGCGTISRARATRTPCASATRSSAKGACGSMPCSRSATRRSSPARRRTRARAGLRFAGRWIAPQQKRRPRSRRARLRSDFDHRLAPRRGRPRHAADLLGRQELQTLLEHFRVDRADPGEGGRHRCAAARGSCTRRLNCCYASACGRAIRSRRCKR